MMQATVVLVVVVASVAGTAATASVRGARTGGFLSFAGEMQPTVVARTLARVEDEWRSQAMRFVECTEDASHADCSSAWKVFNKSCNIIVSAMVAASTGDRDTVTEYMGVVCGEPDLQGWKQERCKSFATAISKTMTADSWENRNRLDAVGLCHSFFSNMTRLEGARVAEEHKSDMQRLKTKRMDKAKESAEKDAAEHARGKKKAQKAAEEASHAVEKTSKTAKLAKEKIADEKVAADKKHPDQEKAEKVARAAAEAEEREADAKLEEAAHVEAEAKRKIAEAIATTRKLHNSTKAIPAEAPKVQLQHKLKNVAAKHAPAPMQSVNAPAHATSKA